jgi:hypothetical protein
MSTIIAGRFDNTRQVQAVLQDLAVARFKRDEFASYYVNPPGQDGLFPLGADWFANPAMRHGDCASAGAVAGGAAGIALGSLAGTMSSDAGAAVAVAAAGLGAYAGALYGALSKTRGDSASTATSIETPVEAGAGPMVAICIDRPGTEQVARAALNRHGAHAIERQEGRWEAGDWKDFEPPSAVTES